jgi:ankyrin repeat protein
MHNILCFIFIQDGCTALMGACSRGHLVVVQYLIAQGADVNSKSNVSNDGMCILFVDLYDACKILLTCDISVVK